MKRLESSDKKESVRECLREGSVRDLREGSASVRDLLEAVLSQTPGGGPPVPGGVVPPSPGLVERNVSRNLTGDLIGVENENIAADRQTSVDTIAIDSLPFEAIIHFTNHFAELNLLSPWKVFAPAAATGTGFCISKRRILTNSHVVRHATSLRVFKHGVPGNYEARVLCQSDECDLALVTVDDEEFWEGLPAVKFQELIPDLDDTVVAVGYPLGASSATLTRGVVSSVNAMDLSLNGTSEKQLMVQIDAAINPGNSGGPVFHQSSNEVVGVAFAGVNNAEGQGLIIPTPVVQNFLKTYEKTGTFGRLPALGVHMQVLNNSAMRELVFNGKPQPNHHDGILITRVKEKSCAEVAGIRAGDILLSIDGNRVSEDGDVAFRNHERVDYQHMITRKKVGDKVTVSLLRNACVAEALDRSESSNDDSRKKKKKGKVFDTNVLVNSKRGQIPPESIDVEVTLAPSHELVPRELGKDYFPEYAIIAGLVFIIAGVPLMTQIISRKDYAGYNIAEEVSELLSDDAYEKEDDATVNDVKDESEEGKMKKYGDQQALICSDCLAHECNVGYTHFVGERLKLVNGVKVRNMTHLVELLEPYMNGCEGNSQEQLRTHVVLQFYGRDASAVFDANKLRAATPAVNEQHRIPSWSSLVN